MACSNIGQEKEDSWVEACSSCSNLDELADKLCQLSVISADDNDKIKTTTTEKYQILLNILMEKELTSLVLKITKMKEKWDSEQNKSLATVHRGDEENRVLTSAEVSEDWELKIFLLKIADSITEYEFEKMKVIVGGELGFKAQALEKIKKPLKLFRHMMTTRKISRYNTLHLQCILWHLQRKDLIEEFMEFSKDNRKRPLYFYTPKDKPENGYRYMNFHVCGDINKMTVQELDQLRVQVSTTLCVPPQFVFLEGIEPSNSILLTFMVPEYSIEAFVSYTEDHQDFVCGFGVLVEFRDGVLTLKEICSEAPQQTSAQKSMETHLKDLLQKEEKLKADLDAQAEQLLDLQEEESNRHAIVKLDHQSLLQETNLYKQMFQKALEAIEHINVSGDMVKNGQSKNIIPSLQIQSCLVLQTTLLSKAYTMKVDKELLRGIVDVTSTLAGLQERQKFVKTLKDYRYIFQTLESRAEIFQNENFRLKANPDTHVPVMSSNLLQDMLTQQELARVRMQQTFELRFSVQPVIAVPTLQLDQQLRFILKTMTDELTDEECNQLCQNLGLSDIEKLTLDLDSSRLLEIAFQREVLAGRGDKPPGMLLESYLKRINRTDLIKKYLPVPVSKPQTSTNKVNKRRRPIRRWKKY